MLPGIVGNIVPFDPNVCKFSTYTARFRQFLAVNNIADTKHVPTFLTVIGDAHYQLLVNLLCPEEPATRTLDQLIAALTAHFEPATLEVAERQKFYSRRQSDRESIAEFSAELRRLSLTCRFDNQYLASSLRDQFVAGVRSDAVKRKLLTTANLTFASAVETAQQYEAADRDIASVLHGGSTSGSANSGSNSAAIANVSGKKQFQKSGAQKKGKKRNNGPPPPASGLATNKNTPKKNSTPKPGTSCHRCGKTDHWAPNCPHVTDTCYNCNKKGHLATVCRSRGSSSGVHMTEGDIGAIYNFHAPDSIKVPVLINSKPFSMELDTGAVFSIINEEHWKDFGSPPLAPSSIVLRSYGGRILKNLGTFVVSVSVNGSTDSVPLLVVRAPNYPALFGRNWLFKFRLDWVSLCRSILPNHSINNISVDDISTKFPDLFRPELGHIKGVKAHIEMRPDAVPKFFKPRPVAFTLIPKIDADLDRLQKMGVIEPIDRSDWAAPIVPVLKPDSSVRICGDFRLTVNPSIQADWFPLPSSEELFASLAGATVISKVDLSDAYLQIELEDAAKQYVVINTHRGLFRYNRLPFGVSFAVGLFQHTMERIVQGLEGVRCYLDDLIVSGPTQEIHDARLYALLQRLQEHGVRLKKSKCLISQSSLVYLGHLISAAGIQPVAEKVDAILKAPRPTDVSTLRSFLGILQYYAKFIPHTASRAAPMHRLLQKGVPWKWSSECEKAFIDLKNAITSDSVLVHYDSKLPLVLDCDASSFGIGAALSHIMPDGTHRPIAFSSKTLGSSERNYSQIEREALSLIFGVKKFHRYLFGRKFELVTDHKPLVMVMGPKGHIASVSASRLHRWAFILSSYDFSIKFRPTAQHGNADFLSRLPLPNTTDTCLDSVDSEPILLISFLDDVTTPPVTHKQVRLATAKDSLLTEVMRYVQSGWPFESHCPVDALQPYFTRRTELSISGGCLLWGLRLIIPAALRSPILDALHDTHSGIVRMKSIARGYIWWPKIDSEIENLAKSCPSCAENSAAPVKAPLHPWAFPVRPWQRIHIDFCGPLFDRHWLILVDAHSKWPEAIPFPAAPSSGTLIEALSSIFSRFGYCEEIVSDNAPYFSSEQFHRFCETNGIRHRLVAPYNPASNGEAERFVRSFKDGLKPMKGSDWKWNVEKFLMAYRATPHATTGRTPSELLIGRIIRTKWDLLRPSVSEAVEAAQTRQKVASGGKERSFGVGDYVWARDFRGRAKWVPGEIITVLGPRNYRIRTAIGTWMRHINQLRLRSANSASVPSMDPLEDFTPSVQPPPFIHSPPSTPFHTPPSTPTSSIGNGATSTPLASTGSAVSTPAASPMLRRYPVRVHRPPDRFSPT